SEERIQDPCRLEHRLWTSKMALLPDERIPVKRKTRRDLNRSATQSLGDHASDEHASVVNDESRSVDLIEGLHLREHVLTALQRLQAECRHCRPPCRIIGGKPIDAVPPRCEGRI